MKKILLASVGVMVMSAGMAYAACIPTPSCSSLGYESSSSCEGGIKCPFGNAWNCTLTDIKNKVTEITNKVTEIENKITTMEMKDCVIGSIFYSDKTCSSGVVVANKTPIGVVIDSDGSGHGLIMSLGSIGTYNWGGYGTDASTLQNFLSFSDASQDLASCENTQKIIALGDKDVYPAAWAAHEYKTEGTNAGDWCLPAAGVMSKIGHNLDLINTGYTLVGDINISERIYMWSSSEYDSEHAWFSYFKYSHGLYYEYFSGGSSSSVYRTKRGSAEVWPVLEF